MDSSDNINTEHHQRLSPSNEYNSPLSPTQTVLPHRRHGYTKRQEVEPYSWRSRTRMTKPSCAHLPPLPSISQPLFSQPARFFSISSWVLPKLGLPLMFLPRKVNTFTSFTSSSLRLHRHPRATNTSARSPQPKPSYRIADTRPGIRCPLRRMARCHARPARRLPGLRGWLRGPDQCHSWLASQLTRYRRRVYAER